MIKLLLSDVDGTLVTQDKVLLPSSKDAIHALREQGILFTMTSGRPPRGMQFLMEELGITLPFAGFNGASFVRPDLAPLEEKTLPPETAAFAHDFMRKAGLDVWAYCGNDWYCDSAHGPHVDRESFTVRFGPTVVPDPGAHLSRAVKLVGVSDDRPLVARCQRDLQAALDGQAAVSCSQPYYLDVTHPAATKGSVVHMLCRHLDLLPEEVATIGDSQNDVSMFRESGLSIAMGNASPEVRAAATRVTRTNAEDGFALALRGLLD